MQKKAKKARKKNKLPPRDSWIALEPGRSIKIDASLQQDWGEKTRALRQARGATLAACFEVEYQVDLVLCEALFPGVDGPNSSPSDRVTLTVQEGKARKGLFDELILKDAPMAMISFRFKVELLGRLASRIPPVQAAMPEELLAKLDKVRRVRNRFAHYPVSFVPEGDPPNQRLSARLVCRDKTLVLDDEFFRRHSELFTDVMAGLEQTLKNLREGGAGAEQRPVSASRNRQTP